MKLIPNWRKVSRKAYSVRLMYVAAVMTGAEALLPLVSDYFKRGTFAILTFFVVAGAILARFVVQQELHDE
jgi:hypothetical protein